MLTNRDLRLHVVAGGRDPAHVWVSECMTADPMDCTAEDDVLGALELIKEYQVRRLPVVNARREIVSIVALSDLVPKNALGNGEIGAALQGICEPGHKPKRSVTEIITAA